MKGTPGLPFLPSPRRLACVAPFVFATAAAHATTDWVDTHTKAF